MKGIIKGINVNIPYFEIYARLGYRKAHTQISDTEKDKIDKIIKEASTYIDLAGKYQLFDIEKNIDEGSIIIKSNEKSLNNFVFKSFDLLNMLKESSKIFIFCVTAGNRIIGERDKLIEAGDGYRSVIYDATGSEIVEEGANYINNFLEKLIKTKGGKLTNRRFSPGYGDFELQNQKTIFEIIKPEEIGVTLTSNFIMQPEKSITAIVGVL